LIQSATDTTTQQQHQQSPRPSFPPSNQGKQQQSLFQLRQPIPFHQGLSSTQEIISRANIQPEQQGQGQEADGASQPGEGELRNYFRTPRGCANNDGYFLYKPSTRDYTF
jgi:hypothetical protein